MKVESNKIQIETSAENIYDYVSNFSNLKMALPSQVQNFCATENECSFEVSSMAKVTIRMKEKCRPDKVVMEALQGESPIPFQMSFCFDCKGEDRCEAKLIIDADVPVFLSGMVKKPLEKIVEQVSIKLAEFGK